MREHLMQNYKEPHTIKHQYQNIHYYEEKSPHALRLSSESEQSH